MKGIIYLKSNLFLFLFLSLLLAQEVSSQNNICNENGICHDNRNNEINMNEIIIDDEPKVSRYASSDGHATEAPKECFDRHEDCDLFVSHGECIKNPGWMIINCPVGCKACHLRDSKIRCPRKALNISEESVLKPGTLNQIFQRIIQLSNENQIGKINVLSNDPWIIEFENFITPLEAKSIITAVHDWEKSTDTGEMNEYGEQGRILSTGRTSTNAWCRDDCESKPNVQRVLKRIEFVTTVPIDNYESFQVLKYDIGQYYRAHHDTGADEDNLACGMRILTFFLYLSDVEIGGETSFPLLNLSVKPKLGKAVLWPGVYSDNPSVVDYRTRHEAKPVIKGIKYGANSWIHSHNFKIPNLWGCTGSFD